MEQKLLPDIPPSLLAYFQVAGEVDLSLVALARYGLNLPAISQVRQLLHRHRGEMAQVHQKQKRELAQTIDGLKREVDAVNLGPMKVARAKDPEPQRAAQ